MALRVSSRSGPLLGTAGIPAGEVASMMALILGALASGATSVRGVLESAPVTALIAVLRQLGVDVSKENDVWFVKGLQGRFAVPEQVLDVGGSRTLAMLLLGLLAARGETCFLTGTGSVTADSFTDLLRLLEQMGAQVMTRTGGRLPIGIVGAVKAMPLVQRSLIEDPAFRTALLLAATGADGLSTLIEKTPSAEESESLLALFGASLTYEPTADGAKALSVAGPCALMGQHVVVTGTMRVAAAPLIAALLRPGSAVTLRPVVLDAQGMLLVETLKKMGASVVLSGVRDSNGLTTADLMVQGSALTGVTLPRVQAAQLLRAFPVLAVAASCAREPSRFCGLGHGDKSLDALCEGLVAQGAMVELDGADWVFAGSGLPPRGGGVCATTDDPYLALAFAVLGAVTNARVLFDDNGVLDAGLPGVVEMMNRLGCKIAFEDAARIRSVV